MDILATYAGQTGLLYGTAETVAAKTQAQEDQNTEQALSALQSEADTVAISEEARELLAVQAGSESAGTDAEETDSESTSSDETQDTTAQETDLGLHVSSSGMANGAAATYVGGGTKSVSETVTDTEDLEEQIDELEEEIEQLEQEIAELEAKGDEASQSELKSKQTELASKQSELAVLQGQLAEAQGG